MVDERPGGNMLDEVIEEVGPEKDSLGTDYEACQ